MKEHILSPDSQAILLLCGSLGGRSSGAYEPLNVREYNSLAQWLFDKNMRPADLLNDDGVAKLREDALFTSQVERLLFLLGRGAKMAFSVEKWTNNGIWVLCRVDTDYPTKLKDRLKRSAPPILYGVGDKNLLDSGGLAIVGSRNVDEEGLGFTQNIAARCAKDGVQIVSGGARGVDSEAMMTTLKDGGLALGVLSHELSRAAVSGKYRNYLMGGSLTLVSPYDPQAGFTVGTAMGRNKIIYCLSDWALIVDATAKKGGTWNGAQENLKGRWVVLYVRSGPSVPDGNNRLIDQGGIPLTAKDLEGYEELGAWLTEKAQFKHSPKNEDVERQLPLFPDS